MAYIGFILPYFLPYRRDTIGVCPAPCPHRKAHSEHPRIPQSSRTLAEAWTASTPVLAISVATLSAETPEPAMIDRPCGGLDHRRDHLRTLLRGRRAARGQDMVIAQRRDLLDRLDRIGHQVDRPVKDDRNARRRIPPAREQVEVEAPVVGHCTDDHARHPIATRRRISSVASAMSAAPKRKSLARGRTMACTGTPDSTAWATRAAEGVSPPSPKAPHSSMRSAPAAMTAATPSASSTQISSKGGPAGPVT